MDEAEDKKVRGVNTSTMHAVVGTDRRPRVSTNNNGEGLSDRLCVILLYYVMLICGPGLHQAF